jgi:hypothetical protein
MAKKKSSARKAPKKSKKKAAKRKAPAKRKAKKRPSGDRFSQLTAAHAKAVAAGEHHFASLLKREITKGGKARRK